MSCTFVMPNKLERRVCVKFCIKPGWSATVTFETIKIKHLEMKHIWNVKSVLEKRKRVVGGREAINDDSPCWLCFSILKTVFIMNWFELVKRLIRLSTKKFELNYENVKETFRTVPCPLNQSVNFQLINKFQSHLSTLTHRTLALVIFYIISKTPRRTTIWW